MNKNLRAASYMALLAIGSLLTIAPAHAQSVYGSIFGTVTDKTGAGADFAIGITGLGRYCQAAAENPESVTLNCDSRQSRIGGFPAH